MICAEYSSSGTEMTETSAVVLSMPMVSLPVGGMITRIACGRMIRLMVCSRLMPSAPAASDWPFSTDRIPARTISDMYAAWFSPSPRIAAVNGVMIRFASKSTPGIPKVIEG